MSRHDQREEQQYAPGGAEFVQQSPEKLPHDVQRPRSSAVVSNFVPVDVVAVEPVAGAGVGGELRPQIVDSAAFTDALPEIPDALDRRLARSCGTRGWWGGGTHRLQYRTLPGRLRNGACWKIDRGKGGSGIIATKRTAKLHFAKPKLVAQPVGGVGEFLQLLAAVGFSRSSCSAP